MPIHCHTDDQRGFTHVRFDGAPPTLEDVLGLVDRLVTDPAIDPAAGVLADCRHPTAGAFGPAERDQLTARLQQEHRLHDMRLAILTARPSLYGIFRMVAASLELTSSIRAAVFVDQTAAEAWLAGGS